MSRKNWLGGAGFSSYRLTQKLVGLVVLFLVLLADQVSKYWILYGLKLPSRESIPVTSWFSLTMVWNHAVTFGMLGGHTRWLFIVVSLLAVMALLFVLMKSRRWLVSIACGGIIGGAIGNVIDRFNYGAVVDFLHFHVGNWSWYVFNIADSAIVCGVGLWVIDTLFLDSEAKAP
ncbi:signal peptidase II [Acetobacteraceae bacterium ESL0709]|nr:signal peptidase II [Acetobacteraceae bacterium ESL0697]MDF7678491.1 signal peptidase II [Acetobacteraceae bacterium ESL0709]